MIGALKGKIDRCSREIERKGSVSMRRDDNFCIVLEVFCVWGILSLFDRWTRRVKYRIVQKIFKKDG